MAVRLEDSRSRISTDPLRNFKFQLNINHPDHQGILRMGFMTVSGLAANTAPIPYREGGNNTTTRKLPGQTDFPEVTCSRGLAVGSNDLWAWMLDIFAVIQGTGSGAAGHDFRCTTTILILDHPVTSGLMPVKAKFTLYNCWPTAVTFSDLDAGGNGLLMQQLTMAHEGFWVELADAQPNTFDVGNAPHPG